MSLGAQRWPSNWATAPETLGRVGAVAVLGEILLRPPTLNSRCILRTAEFRRARAQSIGITAPILLISLLPAKLRARHFKARALQPYPITTYPVSMRIGGIFAPRTRCAGIIRLFPPIGVFYITSAAGDRTGNPHFWSVAKKYQLR